MILPDENMFPGNAIQLLTTRIGLMDTDLFVAKRPLRNTDPAQSVGVYGDQWVPNEDSYEIGGVEPTLGTYLLGIQSLASHTDEVIGLATHSTMTKKIRSMLYRDAPLRVALQRLSVVDEYGVTEATQRFGIRGTQYRANDLQGQWLYLSTIVFFLETEIR